MKEYLKKKLKWCCHDKNRGQLNYCKLILYYGNFKCKNCGFEYKNLVDNLKDEVIKISEELNQ